MAPRWPTTDSFDAWLRCTADWALQPRAGEARQYAHFVLDRYAREGEAKATKALIKKLEAAPPRDSLARLGDARAIASAHLDLDDDGDGILVVLAWAVGGVVRSHLIAPGRAC